MNKSSILGKSSVFLDQSTLSSQTKHLVPLIRQNNFQTVHKCLSPQQIFYQDPKSRNLLYYACYYNKPDIFLYLINRGVPLNQLDNQGRNIWHVCAYTGSLYCFGILLNHNDCLRRMIAGKNLKQALDKYKFKKSDYKNGQLVISTTESRINDFKAFKQAAQTIVRTYFSNKLDQYESGLSVQDSSESRTPIHLGSLNKSQRSFQIIQLMLREIIPEYKDYLQLSQRISSTIQNYQDPRIYNNILSDLMNAIGINQFEQIQSQQRSNFSKFLKTIINLKDKGGFTALHLSSYGGSTSISGILKRMGAQISDPEGNEGQNIVEIAKNNSVRSTIMSLCQASEIGDNSTINLLINCGQDINAKKTIFGITPLYNSIVYCQKTNKADPAKILLQNGADINTQDVNGWTSLHKACQIGNVEMVELLLSKKASTKKASNKGWLPLHIAATNNHYQIIQLLHSHTKQINLDVKDHQGATPLILAAKKGANKAICKLIELGANLYAFDNKKMTSLHYATFKQHLDTIKTLLYYDADYDKLRAMKNCHGKPAKQLSNDSTTRSQFDNVWSASREGKLDILRRLILQGANKDEQTYHLKRTPLMYAIKGGHVLVTKYLLQSGASTYPEDSEEQIATNYVAQYLKTVQKKQKNKGEQTAKQIRRLIEQFEG